ncbi:MAG: ABC transporter ATP-binding protein/permease [Pseudomonadota bacterium]
MPSTEDKTAPAYPIDGGAERPDPDSLTTEQPFEAQAARRSGWRIIRRLAPYLWPKGEAWVKRRVVLAIAALISAKLIAVGLPFLYSGAVDQLAGKAQSVAGVFAIGAIGLTIAYGIARFSNVAFQQLRDVVFAPVAQRALRTIARATISHIHNLSLRYHLGRRTGALSRIIERGVKGVATLLEFLLFSIAPMLLELLMISVILVVVFDVRYVMVVAVTVVFYVWFTTVVTEWRVKIRREMNDRDKEANQKAIDGLLNYETVKYFNAERLESERYDTAMAGYEHASIRSVRSLAALNLGQSFVINAGLVLVLCLAARDVALGELTVGGFVMVNAYMMQVMMPLDFLGYVYREIRQALIDMSEMYELLEQRVEVTDRDDATELELAGGEIHFDRVAFSYDGERTILDEFDLTVGAGQTVAIVGASGSGKSTIGRVLFRFYDVARGAVRIDGQDIRDVTQDSLHRAIGVVPQDTVLFNDTIFYNIAYGRSDATPDDVTAAARAAKISDFVENLPDGYETRVGERGLKLSGGEKQRVGIARTLLKDPAILILDEATSALDTHTEQEIQESLHAMAEGRTVIVIAHRLSTVVDADQIVVLRDGRIAELGTHDALLSQRGVYAGMWEQQQKQADNHSP